MRQSRALDNEVAQMQRDIEELLLPDLCAIQSVTRTADGQGGWTEAWATTDSAYCRLDNSGGKKGVYGDVVKAFSSWVLTVPESTIVSTANRIVHNGETYTVTAISDKGSWLTVKRLTLERVV